jgi:hypothetical protein
VKLRSLAVFGVGYVLGTRAGRERYGQIVAAAQDAAKRLEHNSENVDAFKGTIDNLAGRINGFRARLQDYSSE